MIRNGGVRPAPAKPAGFALLMALVVVLLLSAFITEYFFNTGLELWSMQTFKDAAQAHMDLESRRTTGSTILIP